VFINFSFRRKQQVSTAYRKRAGSRIITRPLAAGGTDPFNCNLALPELSKGLYLIK
jgi:hypothetical protein